MYGIVALSGYNTRSLIAFCRFLSQKGMMAHLWASCDSDPIFLTKYGEWVFSNRQSRLLDLPSFLSFVESVKSKYKYERIIVLPSTEYLNRFLLENRLILEANDIAVPLVEKEVYEAVSDKFSFGELCRNYGIVVPSEIPFDDVALPVVAKPKRYCFSSSVQHKPLLIYTKEELEKFYCSDEKNEFYLQEYIDGGSFYLLYYFSKNGRVASLSQENLIQQSAGRSIVAAKLAGIHLDVISEKYIAMLADIGFHGLIMIEVRMHKENFYMIEANPRFWGPMQLVVDAGGILLEEFLCDNGLMAEGEITVEPVRDTNCRYFWSGGVVEDQRNNKSLTFHAFNEVEFFCQYREFIAQDIYMRSDSMELYKYEINGGD